MRVYVSAYGACAYVYALHVMCVCACEYAYYMYGCVYACAYVFYLYVSAHVHVRMCIICI
jgi:hypothetical protein